MRSRLRYDPWGKERYTQNTTPTGYRYTSQRWDAGLGLYDYNARYYDPALGKFINADSLVPDPASPQAFNRYAYVRNSPTNRVDPTGHRDIATDQGGGGGLDIRLPILTKAEADKALKSLGQGVVTAASVLPVAGDVIDGYDFLSALYRGEYAEAGFIAGMAVLPDSTRLLRGAGGEVVEFAAHNLDEVNEIIRGGSIWTPNSKRGLNPVENAYTHWIDHGSRAIAFSRKMLYV